MQKLLKNAMGRKQIKWQHLLLLLTGIIVFAWLSLIALAPLQKRMELQQMAVKDSLFAGNFKGIYNHPEMHSLVREKYFREALLELAEKDSIQLVINLQDSTIGISIRGVDIHTVPIREFKRDKLLDNIPMNQEMYLFSRPLPATARLATIVKQPVVVRLAPKDTLEAAQNAWKPDTLIQHPAFVALSTEHQIRVILEQDRNRRFDDYWTKCGFYSRMYLHQTIVSLKNFICFKKQEYMPTITIKMPLNDLRAIYRALPHNIYLVLKL